MFTPLPLKAAIMPGPNTAILVSAVENPMSRPRCSANCKINGLRPLVVPSWIPALTRYSGKWSPNGNGPLSGSRIRSFTTLAISPAGQLRVLRCQRVKTGTCS